MIISKSFNYKYTHNAPHVQYQHFLLIEQETGLYTNLNILPALLTLGAIMFTYNTLKYTSYRLLLLLLYIYWAPYLKNSSKCFTKITKL